jgi:hypothetical protein
LIDAPNRAAPRFPPSKESAVRQRMAVQLEAWRVSPGDLCISSGGRGADILFAELCRQLGANMLMLQPLSDDEFIEASVHLPGTDWESRFRALRAITETRFLADREGPRLEGESVFERNNNWVLETARAACRGRPLRALLVWDELPTGDGPGGTSHFASEVRRLRGEVVIINPTKIELLH